MPALFFNIIKLLFLAMLFVFLWQVAKSIRAHVGSNPGTKSDGFAAEVVMLTGAGDPERIRLRPQGHVFGRSDEADVPIDDPYSSEFHARVGVQDGKVIWVPLDAAMAYEGQTDPTMYWVETTSSEPESVNQVAADIRSSLAAEGIQVERRRIVLEDPIKAIGAFDVPVRVHREVTASFKVEVTAEEERE